MARTMLPPVLAMLVAACGGSAPVAAGDASVDALPDGPAAVDVGVVAPVDAGPDAPPAPFPAFTPRPPAVVSLGGPVLAAPRLVPVFIVDPASGVDPEVARVEPFLTAYAASSAWRAQLAEYGVGPGTVAPALRVPPGALGNGLIPSTRLVSWLLAQVGSGAWGAPDENTLYLVMLDGSRQVQVGASRTCEGVGGYHSDVRGQGGRRIAYAVIPDCGQGVDAQTRVLSHEIVEAATDPYPNLAPGYTQPSVEDPPEGAWAIAYTGGEVGDMCEQRSDAAARPAELEHDIQRSWSNRAAAAGVDPCVPAPGGAVYFGAVPALPETLRMTGRDRLRGVSVRGVTLPPGGRQTIDLRLFSTAPTAGSIRVSVREIDVAGAAPAFRYTLNRGSGVNGDVLRLTITATGDAPEGRVFEVFTTLNGYNNNWVGAVATAE